MDICMSCRRWTRETADGCYLNVKIIYFDLLFVVDLLYNLLFNELKASSKSTTKTHFGQRVNMHPQWQNIQHGPVHLISPLEERLAVGSMGEHGTVAQWKSRIS